MKNLFTSLALASALFAGPALAQETPATLDGVKLVSAEQARDLAAKGATFVDTRTPNEFSEKSAKGAVNVPYKEKSAKAANFEKSADAFDLTKLPADKGANVIFFCNSGTCWKSYKAAVVARDAGYKQVAWFRGGMPEWSSKGLPTQ